MSLGLFYRGGHSASISHCHGVDKLSKLIKCSRKLGHYGTPRHRSASVMTSYRSAQKHDSCETDPRIKASKIANFQESRMCVTKCCTKYSFQNTEINLSFNINSREKYRIEYMETLGMPDLDSNLTFQQDGLHQNKCSFCDNPPCKRFEKAPKPGTQDGQGNGIWRSGQHSERKIENENFSASCICGHRAIFLGKLPRKYSVCVTSSSIFARSLHQGLIFTSKWPNVHKGIPTISKRTLFTKAPSGGKSKVGQDWFSTRPIWQRVPSGDKLDLSHSPLMRTVLRAAPPFDYSAGNTASIVRPASSKSTNSRQIFTKNSKRSVTLENIFSSENKSRSTEALNTCSIEPVKSIEVPIHKKKREAAVLVPLCTVSGVPSILFTLRTTKMNNHRGQVSFPGGMQDEEDESIIVTAIREMEEELGLPRDKIDVWGTLPPTSSKHDGRIIVTPVIATCGEISDDSLNVNPDEVEELFCQSIESLCDPKNQGYTRFRTVIKPVYPHGYTLPVFTGGSHRIWGLTAIVLHQTLQAVAPGMYNYKLRHGRPPVRQGVKTPSLIC